jgi:hypothetical protein
MDAAREPKLSGGLDGKWGVMPDNGWLRPAVWRGVVAFRLFPVQEKVRVEVLARELGTMPKEKGLRNVC